MTLEERLDHLLKEHGVGCPRAVSLGGPAAVEAWCEQQELDIEARAEAEKAEADGIAAANAIAEGEGAILADVVAEFPSVLARLGAVEDAVAALHASGPTEEAVGEVAAGGNGPPTIHGPHDPEPDGTKAPEPEKPKAEKPKAGKKGGKGK